MLRIIEIKGRTGRFSVPSFPLTDNEELTIKFNIYETRFGRYIVIVKHGNLQKTFALDPKEMAVTLTPDWIKAGGLEPIYFLLEFRNPTADKVIIGNDPNKNNGFFIEPLYITRVDGNTTGIAWLNKIETELTTARELLTKYGAVIEQIPALIKQAKREAIIEARDGDIMNV